MFCEVRHIIPHLCLSGGGEVERLGVDLLREGSGTGDQADSGKTSKELHIE